MRKFTKLFALHSSVRPVYLSAIVVCAVALPSFAQTTAILSVQVDRDIDTLFIMGTDLHDGSGPPPATLGGDVLTNNFYDPGDDTMLAYDLPSVLPDGDAELTLNAPGGFLSYLIGLQVFSGPSNTAAGQDALLRNTTGDRNTAVGAGALKQNTEGIRNTALGNNSLKFNTTGLRNTASGASALKDNTFGNRNTATGASALNTNIEGNRNTATGASALASNTTGNNNTALGNSALSQSDVGNRNVAIGNAAGENLINGNDNIYISNPGIATESGSIRIGTEGMQSQTFIAGINGSSPAGTTIPVVIDEFGQLATDPSIGGPVDFSDLTGTPTDAQIPDDITINNAATAGNADTVDGFHATDLEESAEIIAAVASHEAIPDAHHAKTSSFTELSDSATDSQIPDDITIHYAASAGNALTAGDATTAGFASTAGDADTVDGIEAADLEESAEIDADIATHTADTNAHHTAFTTATNTGVGDQAAISVTTGSGNTGLGTFALQQTTEGENNTATGHQSLFGNTTGNQNTATGSYTLRVNTTGVSNTATGVQSLLSNTTGSGNTALGVNSSFSNTTGSDNTAVGGNSLRSLATGNRNAALGINAGRNATTGDDNIFISNQGDTADSGTIRIGTEGIQTQTFVAGVNGATIAGTPIPVVIDEFGQLSTDASIAAAIDFADLTGTATDAQIPDDITILFAVTAGDADTVDGIEAADLEESAEIINAVSNHSAVPDAHHTKTVSFSELVDSASDVQIPDDITINYALSAGDSDSVDGLQGTDLEESAEIDADISAHAADTNAHHDAFTNTVNTGVGVQALTALTTGNNNTAVGARALSSTTSGTNNTATGFWALRDNTTGGENTAIGYTSLWQNTLGTSNSALGYGSLKSNSSGANNTALGRDSLRENSSGGKNTSVGGETLWNNTTGQLNVALGFKAGFNATTGNNNIYISNPGLVGDSGVIKIGTEGTQTQTFLAGINGSTLAGTPVAVVVDEFGQLSTDESIGSGATDFSELTGTATDTQIPDDITILFASAAGDSDTVDGIQAVDLEESAEIDADIAAHSDLANVHHAKTVSFSELLDSASDIQIPDDITINFATSAGDSDTVDGIHGTDLEESAEIDADIAIHSSDTNAHHAAFTDANNTSVGLNALGNVTSGARNTASGFEALSAIQTDSDNTAIGYDALNSTTSNANTGIGSFALQNNTSGPSNTALGAASMRSNVTGSSNTAIGRNSLLLNTTGNENVASGYEALQNNVSGSSNTAVGHTALRSLTTGGNNTALGYRAGINATTGDDNILISNEGDTADTATIRVGTEGTQTQTFVAGIQGVIPTGSISPVVINDQGQLGTVSSLPISLEVAMFRDEKPENAIGGSSVNGGWIVRTLNQDLYPELDPNDNMALLPGDIIHLMPGTYLVEGSCPAYRVNRTQSRFVRVDPGPQTTAIIGQSRYSPNQPDGPSISVPFEGFVTVTTPAGESFKVEHWTQTGSPNGLGTESGSVGDPEIFTTVIIWKIR